LQFDYAEALLIEAIGGGGIIQAPKYIVADAIQCKLQPILMDYAAKEATTIAIVYPQKKYLSAKVRVFIELEMLVAGKVESRCYRLSLISR
jgi:LysR family transcriptional regulator for bpeEF and oprC